MERQEHTLCVRKKKRITQTPPTSWHRPHGFWQQQLNQSPARRNSFEWWHKANQNMDHRELPGIDGFWEQNTPILLRSCPRSSHQQLCTSLSLKTRIPTWISYKIAFQFHLLGSCVRTGCWGFPVKNSPSPAPNCVAAGERCRWLRSQFSLDLCVNKFPFLSVFFTWSWRAGKLWGTRHKRTETWPQTCPAQSSFPQAFTPSGPGHGMGWHMKFWNQLVSSWASEQIS